MGGKKRGLRCAKAKRVSFNQYELWWWGRVKILGLLIMGLRAASSKQNKVSQKLFHFCK
jgi:hypothetical protein